VIKGVNQRSLALLIDQPSVATLARGGLRGRNLSIGIPGLETSGMFSPGYQSIVQSARRESKELSFEAGGSKTTRNNISAILSPHRKKNSHALLYGNG